MKRKILLYDDEKRIAQIYVKSLEKMDEIAKSFEISPLGDATFEKELTVLETRRNSQRTKEKPDDAHSLLDETSIFIIDFDLLQYSGKRYLTGEDVAYLARCFSECRLIIGLNQFNHPGETIFDLTLKGHPESYCDLNLPGAQICNPGLWGENRVKFRPWHWPQLMDYVEVIDKRNEETKSHLDDPIVEVLGFDKLVNNLSILASEFIGPDPKNTTIREFAEQTGKGLKPKDVNTDEDMVARIAGARVAKWLERLVFPGQDVLIDAPHLVSRYPSLLNTDHKSQSAWSMTASFGDSQELPLDHKLIEQYRFQKSNWLSRPAWFWNMVSSSRKIREVSKPWEKEVVNFRFCEDSSTFERRKNCRDFRAGVDSIYVQRFVNRPLIKGINYQPRVRLL
jgi:hypothetical protein